MPAAGRNHVAALILIALAALQPTAASGQIRHVAELDTEQIRALDRETTVVLLPGGILEEHGPYLPSFSDGYWNERLTLELAEAIVARPGWTALIFPLIPLGNSGANDVGGHFSFPGSYPVRFTTLRSVFMDLASELGTQGFRHIFIVHMHGAPNHSRALEQAGDYFGDTHGGRMVHLGGLLPAMEAWAGEKSEAEAAEDGFPIHSGMDETSWMLFLRPDLVRRGYSSAAPLTAADMAAVIRLAQQPAWPGYIGSPRLATAAHGAAIWHRARSVITELALGILDGRDPREIPRFSDEMLSSPEDVELDRASLEHEAREARRQEEWLRRRGL